MKKFLFFAIALMIATAVPPLVLAAQFSGGERYTLRSGDRVSDDLYAAGGEVALEGAVLGDFIGAGGDVTISGPVSGDVSAAGGTVVIEGDVGDDLRAAGGKVSVSGAVGDDAITAGGQVNFRSGSAVDGDAIVLGGTVTVSGVVNGDLRVYGGEVYLEGRVDGNVIVHADGRLTVGDNAAVGGTLSYRASEETVIPAGAKIGRVEYGGRRFPARDSAAAKRGLLAFLTVWWILKLLATLAAGLALYFLVRRPAERLVADGMGGFGRETVRGLVVLIVCPVALFLLFLTGFGAILALLGGLLYALLLLVGWLLAGAFLGTLAASAIGKRTDRPVNAKTVAGGIVLLGVVKLVPFVGWIIALLFWLAGIGVVSAALWDGVRHAK